MVQVETTNHPLPQTPNSPLGGQWDGLQEQYNEGHFDESRRIAEGSLQQHKLPESAFSVKRKSVPVMYQPEVRLQETPASPVNISPPRLDLREPDAASIKDADYFNDISQPLSQHLHTPESVPQIDSSTLLAFRKRPASSQMRVAEEDSTHSRASSGSYPRKEEEGDDLDGELHVENHEGLQYLAFDDAPKKRSQNRVSSVASSSSGGDHRASQQLGVPKQSTLSRPTSSYTLASDLRGRTLSPLSANGSDPGSPHGYGRDLSTSRRSPAGRPLSYVNLLNNVPYNQQVAPGSATDHQSLQSAVGTAASLLDTNKTLEMYRANVKKTNDAAVQYEFAIFMIRAAHEVPPSSTLNPAELVSEAKRILQRLADRAYPFAQYYLGDGYCSGLFHKDSQPDYDKAFPFFLAASKHGHAEAAYRAALCYEYGSGTTKSYPKAVQFYRASASKNHPGAATRLGLACIHGEMGLSRDKYREGVKWLKRGSEGADTQYNAAPYELGTLHLTGWGDDIFKDEAYAAQLFTHSAELGHVDANFCMGQVYENGFYGCPRDAALSVHFYNGAASRGLPEAMMALCAWYMLGAEPVLERDEGEACAWAMQAAEKGLAKAEYAVGYFTEMGIGCRRDPLEANVWYVRAADQGNETARQRLQIIRAAAAGGTAVGVEGMGVPMGKGEARSKELAAGGVDGGGGGGREKKKFMGIF